MNSGQLLQTASPLLSLIPGASFLGPVGNLVGSLIGSDDQEAEKVKKMQQNAQESEIQALQNTNNTANAQQGNLMGNPQDDLQRKKQMLASVLGGMV
jgi:hypothetical protein